MCCFVLFKLRSVFSFVALFLVLSVLFDGWLVFIPVLTLLPRLASNC